MKHGTWWLRLTLVLMCMVAPFGNVGVSAADGWRLFAAPGNLRMLRAGDDGPQSYVAAPVRPELRAQAAQIIVEYSGFSPEAQASFQSAVSIWMGLLNAPIPIRVKATWTRLDKDVLGGAGTTGYLINTNTNTIYPVALGQQLANRDPNPDKFDIEAVFNSTGVDWYFGFGQAPAGQYSFATVVLHELARGLGFFDSFGVQQGIGGYGDDAGAPLIFDRYVANSDGVSLVDTSRFPNPSIALAAQLQSNALFFNGVKTRAANVGNPPKLYAPNPFEQGSSVANFDEATYPPGNPNSLMTPFLRAGETILDPGPLTLGVFSDIGWSISASTTPSPSSSPSPSSGGPQRCFPETGKCISGRFLTQWEEHGGLAINGYPLTDERREKLEDGKDYVVQWFERVRMEKHPENSTPNDVLLGQFGRVIHPVDPPVAPAPSQNFFPETGHNVPNDFMAFWDANGGVPQFGFPLSEVIVERLEDGKQYEVQYFERARLERHPENTVPFKVLLGQFGRRILNGGTIPIPSPIPPSNPSPAPTPRPSSSPTPRPSPTPAPSSSDEQLVAAAFQLVASVPEMRHITNNLVANRVSWVFDPALAGLAYGAYFPSTNTIHYNTIFRSMDIHDLASVTGHEGQHAYDIINSGPARTRQDCYVLEFRGFLAGAVLWQSWYGRDGKPRPLNDFEFEQNAILADFVYNDGNGVAQAVVSAYAQQCGRLPNAAVGLPTFPTTFEGLPASAQILFPGAQAQITSLLNMPSIVDLPAPELIPAWGIQ